MKFPNCTHVLNPKTLEIVKLQGITIDTYGLARLVIDGKEPQYIGDWFPAGTASLPPVELGYTPAAWNRAVSDILPVLREAAKKAAPPGMVPAGFTNTPRDANSVDILASLQTLTEIFLCDNFADMLYPQRYLNFQPAKRVLAAVDVIQEVMKSAPSIPGWKVIRFRVPAEREFFVSGQLSRVPEAPVLLNGFNGVNPSFLADVVRSLASKYVLHPGDNLFDKFHGMRFIVEPESAEALSDLVLRSYRRPAPEGYQCVAFRKPVPGELFLDNTEKPRVMGGADGFVPSSGVPDPFVFGERATFALACEARFILEAVLPEEVRQAIDKLDCGCSKEQVRKIAAAVLAAAKKG